MDQKSREGFTQDQCTNPEGEYQAAINMLIYEGQQFWTIMGVFLVAETLLAGLLLNSGTIVLSPWARLVAAGVGLFGCVLWLAAIYRQAGYHVLRIFQARALECQLGYSILHQGGDFSDGKPVNVGGEQHKLRKLPLTIKRTGMLLAILFAGLFITIIVSIIPSLFC